jgi:hypothetical protein
MPPASYLAPDHEAGDVLQEQHHLGAGAQLDEMGARFWADSLNSTPLLATIPTGCPWMRANPVTRVSAVILLELVEFAAVDDPRDDLPDVVGICSSVGTTP